MKSIILILTSILTLNLQSQDIIVFKNGDELESKVTEVLPDAIKYKKWDNIDGPMYSAFKSEVFMIKYKNGTKDIFNTSQLQPSSSDNSNNDKVPTVRKSDLIKDSLKNEFEENQNEKIQKVYEDGKVYYGEWKDDKRNGKGRLTYKDGSFYEGEWKDDKMEGDGIIVSSKNGSKYVGQFLNGQKHGKGIVYDKNQNIEAEYNYVAGNLEGHFITIENNGNNRFEGVMKNGKIDGPGTYYFKDDDGVVKTFNGDYKENEMYNGVLIILYPDGLKYSIEYKNGKSGKMKEIAQSSNMQKKSTIKQNDSPTGCEDVDFLGAYKISGHGAIPDIHVATIRNRATYMKTVHVEWQDEYGRTKKSTFDIKAGDKIDGRLSVSAPEVRPPLNVRITSCE
ncbi:MAG: hypothetical protein IPG18_17315 [Saprospiraceae bacterium]|nr:hypothetical protein [Saprospiraceae bacterium]MBK6783782.1 hypothetical protein [Saprospiraceae bacterium]